MISDHCVMYREWLIDLVERSPRGTQAQLARYLGLSEKKVSEMLSGKRKIAADELPHISRFFRSAPPGFDRKERLLPIVGRVGASTDGTVIHATGDQGIFGEIEAPIGARGTEAVVEVAGHSMGLYAPDGSLILYDDRREPPHEDMIGEVCVVGLPDDRVLVKRLRRGSRPGLFDLESIVGETMRDQPIEWAAVVLMVIHPRHARRLRTG